MFIFEKKVNLHLRGLSVKPGGYATNMVKTFDDHFGVVKRQQLPATADIQEFDGSNTVLAEDAAI